MHKLLIQFKKDLKFNQYALQQLTEVIGDEKQRLREAQLTYLQNLIFCYHDLKIKACNCSEKDSIIQHAQHLFNKYYQLV